MIRVDDYIPNSEKSILDTINGKTRMELDEILGGIKDGEF